MTDSKDTLKPPVSALPQSNGQPDSPASDGAPANEGTPYSDNAEASTDAEAFPGASRIIARQRWQISTAVGLITFILYFSSLSPTVTYSGDCGELISASYRLGIAHPSGYPLYCLLGRVFASITPFGEVAWSYNLLSAVAGALMAGIITATVHRLTVFPQHLTPPKRQNKSPGFIAFLYPQWPAIGAGLLLAGFYDVGTQCLIAEVQAVEATLEASVFYCAVAWHQDRDWRWLFTLSLVFGLSIVAHLTAIFMLPGLFIYAIIQHRARFKHTGNSTGNSLDSATRAGAKPPSNALRWAVLLALPVIVYGLTVYLPLRSQLYPEPSPPRAWAPLDWTHPVDFSRWLTHVTARQYRMHLLKPQDVNIAGHIVHMPWLAKPISSLPGEYAGLLMQLVKSFLWFAPLIAWGALAALRANSPADQRRTGGRWLGIMLVLTCVLNIGIQINYDVGDLPNFFFPSYMAMAILMGLGLAAFFQSMERWADSLTQRTGNPIWRWRLTTFSWLLLLGTIVIQWSIFYGAAALGGATNARDAAVERAEAAERLARETGKTPTLLLMEDDALWGFWYAHFVLGRAPKVNTPWGPLRHQLAENALIIDVVNQHQPTGPVALTQFDVEVDKRYPYTPLTPSGNLWLASHRALPMPATPLQDMEKQPGNTSGSVVNARFRRSKLTYESSSTLSPEDRQSLPEFLLNAVDKTGLAILKRDDLATLDVDFMVTPEMLKRLPGATRDVPNQAAHIGWVEVLLARHGYLDKTPPPGPMTQKENSKHTIWTQQRRLIIPLSAKNNQILRATVPIQVDPYTYSTLYHVWTRIILSPKDTTTPWQQTDLVRLVIVH